MKLERRRGIESSKKLTKAYDKMQRLIDALIKREFSVEQLASINDRIDSINSFTGTNKGLIKKLKKEYSQILEFVKEKLDVVTQHYYRNLWMSYGIMAGVVFSSVFSSNGSMGIGMSVGIGIPLGMVIGAALGEFRDEQIKNEGKQLDIIAEESY